MNKKWGWLAVSALLVGMGWAAEEKAPPAEKKAPASAFLGTAKCKMCHKAQFESWAKSPHAKSMEALEKATPEQVAEMAKKMGVTVEGKASEHPSCLMCHVTGHSQEGGYTAEKGKKEVMDAVACETCHGPGALHMKAKKEEKAKTTIGHPGEAHCLNCHTKEMSPEFNFEEYLKKGVHESIKKGK